LTSISRAISRGIEVDLEVLPGPDYLLEDGQDAVLEAAAITANPQLALWHSFSNEAPGDPTDWYY